MLGWLVIAGAMLACSPEASRGPRDSTSPAAAALAVTPESDGPANEARVQAGAARYAQMCAVCHGENGEGYKADNAPAIAHPDYLAAVSNQLLRASIIHGRKGSTMSAWGHERGGPLGTEDVEALIAYLRSRQTVPQIVLDQRAHTGDAARGQPLYATHCASCHGARGQEGPFVRIGDSEWLALASDGFMRHVIAKGRAGTQMQAFQSTLDSEDIDDIIAWLRGQARKTTPHAKHPGPPPPLPLGDVPLNPRGREPKGFVAYPKFTPVDTVAAEYARKARMVILDARAPTDYAQQHIAGAVSVPFYDPSPYLEKLPKDAWLVCYCGCPHAASGQLAKKLQDAGFTKVTVLDEGLADWAQKGHPVRSGEAP